MDAFVIDAFDFCRQKLERAGETALADMPRLTAELTDAQGSLRWALQGGSSLPAPEPWTWRQ
jgi:uncharacterized protein